MKQLVAHRDLQCFLLLHVWHMLLCRLLPALLVPSTCHSQRPDYPTVLIIDDEKEICELLREFIQDEFNVKVCSDPITAVDMVNKEKFDLVLTDLQMPNISGMGIIRTVRTASPETPIIIVSGNATEQLAQEHGVAGYITKPFKSDEAIKTYLKSKMA